MKTTIIHLLTMLIQLKAFYAYCLLLVLLGCTTSDTLRVYQGEKMPAAEVVILSIVQNDVETRISAIDGEPLPSKFRFELLPGEKIVSANCVKYQPRDPFGTWRGREVLTFTPQAGQKYELHTKTIGPGRCCVERNICTMRIVEKSSGKTVSEIVSQHDARHIIQFK